MANLYEVENDEKRWFLIADCKHDAWQNANEENAASVTFICNLADAVDGRRKPIGRPEQHDGVPVAIADLRVGDVVTHRDGHGKEWFVVTVYSDHAIAVQSAEIGNSEEWRLIRKSEPVTT